jgi:hypothetical protein
MYDARGSLASSGRTSWGGYTYTYEGVYKLGSRPSHAEAMPESGIYSITIGFSAKQSRILDVSFFLENNPPS